MLSRVIVCYADDTKYIYKKSKLVTVIRFNFQHFNMSKTNFKRNLCIKKIKFSVTFACCILVRYVFPFVDDCQQSWLKWSLPIVKKKATEKQQKKKTKKETGKKKIYIQKRYVLFIGRKIICRHNCTLIKAFFFGAKTWDDPYIP